MNWRRVITVLAIVLPIVFISYLAYLYQQLETAFANVDRNLPTQIYSDVARIAPPQSRKDILAQLKAREYAYETEETEIRFRIRKIDYPQYLIPENHPTFYFQGQLLTLFFDGDGDDASLVSISSEEESIDEFFLEPEVIARLTRAEKIRDTVEFEKIPARVWQSIIAVEDQKFLEHRGLDPRAFVRALRVNIKTLSFAQGGSTITQQLVKNLMVRRTKNVFKKINEIFLAIILELRYEKEEILERYLNEVYLGQIGNLEVHGIAEGARYFFGKTIDQLNLAEIALIAGLIRGPIYYSPYRHWERAIKRQQWVLKRMTETGQLSQEEAHNASELPIRLVPPPRHANRAPYFTDFVKAELISRLKERMSEPEIVNSGFRVYTTLDVRTNEIAQKAVREGMETLRKRFPFPEEENAPRLEGALASVDHRNGYIRALVGGSDYRKTTFNRILNMKRQIGSTFKPIVYLSAFAKGYGPGFPLEDARWTLTYDDGRKKWSPKNYKNEYRGWITLREAFIFSVNTIAARLGSLVGIEALTDTAQKLGLGAELPRFPSLSLGIAEASPIDLLRVYATIANRGMRDHLTVIRAITLNDGKAYARFVYQPKQVYDPALTDLITDLMQDVFIEGTAQPAAAMGFDRPAAGKTGTTSDHRDAWFAGFTPQLTTVVWVGLEEGTNVDDKGKTQVHLTGAGSALPIWSSFMKRTLENLPSTGFPTSEFLATVPIDRHSGKRATVECPDSQVIVEKYIVGREPEDYGCEPNWPISDYELVSDGREES